MSAVIYRSLTKKRGTLHSVGDNITKKRAACDRQQPAAFDVSAEW
jgi:hypothetical protein